MGTDVFHMALNAYILKSTHPLKKNHINKVRIVCYIKIAPHPKAAARPIRRSLPEMDMGTGSQEGTQPNEEETQGFTMFFT